MIKIIDYGLGNISAFSNVYKRLNLPAMPAKTPGELKGATRIILPGVGAFDRAMELLDDSGMRPLLESMVHEEKLPVLGICVGMQILVEGSDEGVREGLGWLPGRLRDFATWPEAHGLPTPHMGWNDVRTDLTCPLFKGLHDDARFYFLHSYFFDASDRQHVAGIATYGGEFGCAIHADNIYGVQFHPEKSHHWGATLLKNFAEM